MGECGVCVLGGGEAGLTSMDTASLAVKQVQQARPVTRMRPPAKRNAILNPKLLMSQALIGLNSRLPADHVTQPGITQPIINISHRRETTDMQTLKNTRLYSRTGPNVIVPPPVHLCIDVD